jgi:hypothetical protein
VSAPPALVRVRAGTAGPVDIALPGGIVLSCRAPDSMAWGAAERAAQQVVDHLQKGHDAARAWAQEDLLGWDLDDADQDGLFNFVLAVTLAVRIVTAWNVIVGDGDPADGPSPISEDNLRTVMRRYPLPRLFLAEANTLAPVRIGPAEGNASRSGPLSGSDPTADLAGPA